MIVKNLDLDKYTRRIKDVNRHKGEYIILGLDYVWSINRYNKLSLFRFEIYTTIDIYS